MDDSSLFSENVKHTYSVMQSDGNSFFGDVALNSFNKEYLIPNIRRKKRFVPNFIMKISIFLIFNENV